MHCVGVTSEKCNGMGVAIHSSMNYKSPSDKLVMSINMPYFIRTDYVVGSSLDCNTPSFSCAFRVNSMNIYLLTAEHEVLEHHVKEDVQIPLLHCH